MAVVISDRLLEGSDRLLDGEPDEHLVTLVQSGQEAAFAAIVRRYERELQAQARRLTSDGRGEDAVQQAFLNAFTALQRGGEVRHLRGWLHQILRHEVTRTRMPTEVPLEAATSYGEPLEDTVQRRATAHATLVQLSALPDRQRDALLGTAVLGFPRAHVARTMGLSEGAVRQLVHRARLRLRQAASALIPFPLVKFFGAARSGVDAAPDAALGVGTAASSGVVIKVGALLASGVVATGIAVTHTLPAHHHPAAPAPGARHHTAHARGAAQAASASGVSVAPSDPASITSSLRLHEHGPAGVREDGRSHGGPGRLSGTRSGRGPGSGRGHGAPSAGRGDDGLGGSRGGTSGRGPQGGGTSSRSGSGTASASSDGGDGSTTGRGGSGSGRSGSGSGSGHQGASGSVSGSGSGSGDGGGSSDGGQGSRRSGGDGGSVSSADGDASTPSTSGTSGPASGTTATVTGDETSGDGGQSSDGGGSGGGSGNGGTENSGGSRDVSGSLDSSSS
jgi:RNA polymerase sigma factor (sigma-70 family)